MTLPNPTRSKLCLSSRLPMPMLLRSLRNSSPPARAGMAAAMPPPSNAPTTNTVRIQPMSGLVTAMVASPCQFVRVVYRRRRTEKLWCAWCFELTEEAEQVGARPVFDVSAASKLQDVDDGELHRFPGGADTEKPATVRSGVGVAGDDFVAFGHLVVDGDREVGKSGTQHVVEEVGDAGAVVGRLPLLGCVVDE